MLCLFLSKLPYMRQSGGPPATPGSLPPFYSVFSSLALFVASSTSLLGFLLFCGHLVSRGPTLPGGGVPLLPTVSLSIW